MMVLAGGQASFGQLDDPLLRPERTRIEEERIALACVTGRRLSSSVIHQLCLPATLTSTTTGGRDRGVKQWASVNVSDIESSEHQKRR